MKTLHRDNGVKLGTVNHDGDRLFLTLRAPDGYSGREAAWLLTSSEWERLRAAGDEAVQKIQELAECE